MTYEETLEGLIQEPSADQNYAQIMIEVFSSSKIKEAKKIIEDLGISIIEMNQLSPQSVLFKLNAKETKDVVLKLFEHGFYNLKGINALP